MAWQVQLSWDEGSPDQQGDGFKIYRSVDGGSYSLVATLPLSQTSWEDTNVSPGHKYAYQVKEYKGSEESPAATVTAKLPATPGSCSANYVSDGQIDVAWSNVAYETGYEVQRRVDDGAWTTIANKGADVASHSDTDTSGNHRYQYRVRAKGTPNYVSDWVYSGYVYTTPAAPSGCTAHYVATDKAYCTWDDNSAYEQRFRVEYRINGGSWTFLENTTAGATSSSQVNVGANKKIEFRVRAERTSPDVLQSAYSTSGAVYTTPAAPSNVVAHYQATDKAYCTWTDNSLYEQRFKVEYRIDGGAWTHLEYPGAGATQSSSVSVGANHKVEFRVRAERTSPNALYSSYGTSGPVYTTPSPPSNAQLSWIVIGQQLRLTITDNAAYEQNIQFELEIDGEWQGAAAEPANTTSKTWNVSGNHRYRARARAIRSSPDVLQSAWATSGEVAMVGATDAGQGTESQTKAIQCQATDTGNGAEVALPMCAVASADIGTSGEIISLAAQQNNVDSGSGIDLMATELVIFGVLDTGRGAEIGGLATQCWATELGAGIDSRDALVAYIQAFDTGEGDETSSLEGIYPAFDAAEGTEGSGLAVSLARLDAGIGTDIHGLLLALLAALDAATGQETSGLTGPKYSTDFGQGGDALSGLVLATRDGGGGIDIPISLLAQFLLYELGAGTDTAREFTQIHLLQDGGAGQDAASAWVQIVGIDCGIGNDGQPTLEVLAQVKDAAIGEGQHLYRFVFSAGTACGKLLAVERVASSKSAGRPNLR